MSSEINLRRFIRMVPEQNFCMRFDEYKAKVYLDEVTKKQIFKDYTIQGPYVTYKVLKGLVLLFDKTIASQEVTNPEDARKSLTIHKVNTASGVRFETAKSKAVTKREKELEIPEATKERTTKKLHSMFKVLFDRTASETCIKAIKKTDIIDKHEKDGLRTAIIYTIVQSLFKKFENEWKTLTEEDKEVFYDLPNSFSLRLPEYRQIQWYEGLNSLNKILSNAIGVDLDRLVTNKALIVQSGEDTLSIEDEASITTLVDLLRKHFKLPEELGKAFAAACGGSVDNNNFNNFFGSRESQEPEVEEMRRFLTGWTQLQYSRCTWLLLMLFNQEKVSLVKDTHDKVTVIFNKDTFEVKHHLLLSLTTPETAIQTETSSIFDLDSGKWISNQLTFNVANLEDASREQKKIQDCLIGLGYHNAEAAVKRSGYLSARNILKEMFRLRD